MGSDMLGLEGSTGVGNVSGSTNTSGRGIGGEVGCGFVGMDSAERAFQGLFQGLTVQGAPERFLRRTHQKAGPILGRAP